MCVLADQHLFGPVQVGSFTHPIETSSAAIIGFIRRVEDGVNRLLANREHDDANVSQLAQLPQRSAGEFTVPGRQRPVPW